MRHVEYVPSGVCSRLISFDIDENNTIHNVAFLGGCNGNLKAISKLVEGKKASEIANILTGNTCGSRPTRCADQFAKSLIKAINEEK